MMITYFRASGFRIVLTKSIKETFNQVFGMVSLLKQKLKKLKTEAERMNLIDGLEIYNKKLLSKKSVGRFFSKCIGILMPSANKEIVKILSQKLATFGLAHEKIDKTAKKNPENRVKVIKKALEDKIYEKSELPYFIQFFFSDNYEDKVKNE